jgi:UDP-N-acetylmuramoyl-L-alanyl-D-glutamate--2,6-diaminopimelate ligase
MKFSEMVLKAEEIKDIALGPDFEVNKLRYNSKLVESGDIFFALKGLKADGNVYIDEALLKGAKAVFTDEINPLTDIRVYKVEDCRRIMAVMSNIYYDFPSEKMTMVGVTGTNGKTTITNLINFVLQFAGKKTGLIGTNGNFIKKRYIKTGFTTPESVELNELLNNMYNEGVEYVTMEVSSHALSMKRVYGLDFDVAVFTNLTIDHLDYHKTMDEYFNAKKILFDSMERINRKGNHTKVIYNNNDQYGDKIVSGSESERISYGFNHAAYSIKNLNMSFDGMSFDMQVPLNGEGITELHIDTLLTGRFNVSNILAAAAALKSLKIPYAVIKEAIAEFKPVDGRFNQLKLRNRAAAVIDYSHTPDSLLKAITTIREIMESNLSKADVTDEKLSGGKLITVFGCGGNRDKTKRPKMGEIASKYSDHVIITSDNPRDEEPMAIIEDIKAGITSDNYSVEENRELAIKMAAEMSKEGDVILVAGKGHETYQEIKDVKYDLNDREIVERYS